jgi:hypothetical protein
MLGQLRENGATCVHAPLFRRPVGTERISNRSCGEWLHHAGVQQVTRVFKKIAGHQ